MILKTKEWLKEKRKKFKLTQKDLADESGVNKLTIENLEQGRRKGSEATWKMLEDFFQKKEDGEIISNSYDSEKLIEEIKEDIKEFDKSCKCILFYKIENNSFLFTNYDFITEEEPFTEKELDDNENYLITTLGDALKIFEKQNKI